MAHNDIVGLHDTYSQRDNCNNHDLVHVQYRKFCYPLSREEGMITSLHIGKKNKFHLMGNTISHKMRFFISIFENGLLKTHAITPTSKYLETVQN